MKKEQGITLIALVVTIIILIILGAVSINLIFKENGIIYKAKEASKDMDIEKVYEKLILEKGLLAIEKEGGKMLVDEYVDYIASKGIINQNQSDKQLNGSVSIIVDIYEFLVSQKENDIEIEYMGHAEDRDITLPNEANIIITGSLEQDTLPISIGVEVEHRDDESGVNIKKCKWVYNTIAEAIGTDESLYTEEFNSNPQNMTLNIEEEGEYYLHILTVDNKGNKKETIKGPIAIIAQYHSHTGTTGQTIANGCYITPNTTTVTATCVVTRSNASYSSININKYTCPKCGNDQSGGLDSTKYYAYSHSGCGKATHYYGQGECDEEGCDYLYTAGKTASNHTYQKTTTVYELGCEKDETTVESYKVSY